MKYYKESNNSESFLPVRFSDEIINIVDIIEASNQDNIKGLTDLFKHIEWLKHYISKHSVAFDYGNSHKKLRNGTRFIPEVKIGYTIYDNTKTVFVYVFLIYLDLQQSGLKVPQSLKNNKSGVILENKTLVNNTKRISDDSLYTILMENYDIYWHNLFR